MDIKPLFERLAKSVCVITARNEDGPLASAATAVCNVSLEPPSLLLCVEQGASLSRALAMGADFAVNVLSSSDEGVLEAVATARGPERFSRGDWQALEGGVQILSSAQAWFVCRVARVVSHATHNLYLADIRDAGMSDEPSTLLYFSGSFQTVSVS